MTIYQTILVLAAVFALVGAHQAVSKALTILDGHLERFQGKLDVLVSAQVEYNVMLDGILKRLL